MPERGTPAPGVTREEYQQAVAGGGVVQHTPVPSAALLGALGLALVGGLRRRRR